MKPLEYKTWHHTTTSSTLCRTPHLNNKQNKNTNPIISRQDYHLTHHCPPEEKQTNKNSAQVSPYTKLTQTTGPTLEGRNQKEGIQPWSLGKVKVKSLSHVWLFVTLWTVAYQPPSSMPGKNTGVGCYFLLLGIFPNQGSNLSLLPSEPPGKPLGKGDLKHSKLKTYI